MGKAASAARGAFVEDLSFSGLPFDPTVPALKALILEKLSAASNATIVQMRQDGGMNEGMWLIEAAGSGSLIVKLVPHERRHEKMPSEAEQYQKLAASNPSMIDDPALAFPIKIFHCREQNSPKPSFDLIVMRKASGKAFSEVIARRWFMSQKAELWKELYAIGSFLADVHQRHNNMQHGDFTPSNVFYDEAAETFTMVDLSDFGPQEWNSHQTDVQRFCSGLQMVSKCFGQEFYIEGKRTFEAGYNDRKAGKARSMTYP
jgi:aminoglycoside phosphotransferase (APT) family kinase protein